MFLRILESICHLRGDAEALDLWSLATNGTQERGEVLQGKMLNNAGTALQQQFIAFAGCGTVEVEVAGAMLSEDNPEYAGGHHRLDGV